MGLSRGTRLALGVEVSHNGPEAGGGEGEQKKGCGRTQAVVVNHLEGEDVEELASWRQQLVALLYLPWFQEITLTSHTPHLTLSLGPTVRSRSCFVA